MLDLMVDRVRRMPVLLIVTPSARSAISCTTSRSRGAFPASPSTGAGANQRAVQQWLKAGQFAAARSTHLEAVRHFERALALLASTPESPVRDEQEIELQLARGLSLFTTEGFISNSAAQAYTRARELAERHRDARRLVLAIYGEWQGTAASGRVLAGIPLSRTLLELTNSEADSGLRLQAHHSAWTTYPFSAQPITSREHSAIGRRLYDPEHHRSHRLLFGGHDPGVCARNMGAQAEWQLGYPDTALASSADGLALAERIGHPLSLEMALMFKALLHLERGEPEAALAATDKRRSFGGGATVGLCDQLGPRG
jgi:hypothetical protein